MRREILALALVFVASSARAAVVHDCRIKGIDIFVTHQNVDGQVGHRVAVHYVGFDGLLLSPVLCPDQNSPTVTSDVPLQLTSLDQLGYVWWVGDTGPGVYTFEALTFQGERPIDRVKRFTLR